MALTVIFQSLLNNKLKKEIIRIFNKFELLFRHLHDIFAIFIIIITCKCSFPIKIAKILVKYFHA